MDELFMPIRSNRIAISASETRCACLVVSPVFPLENQCQEVVFCFEISFKAISVVSV